MSKCCSSWFVFIKFNVVVPSDSVCSLGKVFSAALRIRHHTASLGVVDRRCLLDCAVFVFVSNIAFMSILETLIYAQD